MRMNRVLTVFIGISLLATILLPPAWGFWVWTKESGEWVNPKYAVKDTAEEQFLWAKDLFEKADYKRAIAEFRKLIKHYPKSRFAPTSQYYVGRCYEEMGYYYEAFRDYQKVIDKYPYTEKVEEIIERQFKLGNLFYSGQKDKLLGIAIIPSIDRAIEVYEKVVSNAPYGPYADKAQYQLALTYRKLGDYTQACIELRKLLEQYPKSDLLEKARYELAFCSSKASLKPSYDQSATDEAISIFERSLQDEETVENVEETKELLANLKEKKAQTLFDTARFYEKRKKYQSAVLYYDEIRQEYPDTDLAAKASAKSAELKKRMEKKR